MKPISTENMQEVHKSKKGSDVSRTFYDPYIMKVQEDTQLLIRNVIVNMLLCFFIGTTLALWHSNSVLKDENRELTQINEKYSSELSALTLEANKAKDQLRMANTELKSLKLKIEDLQATIDKLTRDPFDLADLRKESNATATKINNKLFGTPLYGHGQEFIDAEKKLGINAWYIVSHAIWESNWGKSKLARTKFNLFGYGAFNENTNKAYSYESYADCIDKVMTKVKANYLTKGGKFYKGYGLEDVNKLYAQNPDGSPNEEWAEGISKLMAQLSR